MISQDGIMSLTTEVGDGDHKVPCEMLIRSGQGRVMVKDFNARLNDDHVQTFNIINIYAYIQGRRVHNTAELGIKRGQSLPCEGVVWP